MRQRLAHLGNGPRTALGRLALVMLPTILGVAACVSEPEAPGRMEAFLEESDPPLAVGIPPSWFGSPNSSSTEVTLVGRSTLRTDPFVARDEASAAAQDRLDAYLRSMADEGWQRLAREGRVPDVTVLVTTNRRLAVAIRAPGVPSRTFDGDPRRLRSQLPTRTPLPDVPVAERVRQVSTLLDSQDRTRVYVQHTLPADRASRWVESALRIRWRNLTGREVDESTERLLRRVASEAIFGREERDESAE